MSIETANGIALPVFTAVPEEAYVPPQPVIGDTDELVDVIDMEPVDEPTPSTSPKLVEAAPNKTDYVKRQKPNRKHPKQDDPDKYLLQAKAIVVQNYNEHRDPRRSPQLNMDLVYITTFTKTLNSWKALIGSTVVRGLMWEVTYNGNLDEDGEPMNEAYIDIFKRINHVRIPLGD